MLLLFVGIFLFFSFNSFNFFFSFLCYCFNQFSFALVELNEPSRNDYFPTMKRREEKSEKKDEEQRLKQLLRKTSLIERKSQRAVKAEENCVTASM